MTDLEKIELISEEFKKFWLQRPALNFQAATGVFIRAAIEEGLHKIANGFI